MSIFSRWFSKKKPVPEKVEAYKTNRHPDSVTFENKVGDRYLKLKDDDCGIVLHGDQTLDILFTKFQNENQSISETEEALMALAVFIKQPGFLDMLLEEFRRIAVNATQKLE